MSRKPFVARVARVQSCSHNDEARQFPPYGFIRFFRKWSPWRGLSRSVGVCMMFALIGGGNFVIASDENRTGWATRFLAEERTPWTGWRNTLAPKGDGGALPLSLEGNANYVIVIPQEPTLQDERAASELELWLEKITGAKFPVVKDTKAPQERELSIGKTNRLTEQAKSASKKAGDHGYSLHLEGERLFFLGEGGPLNAVMAFLEEDLGVCWYTGANLDGWSEHTKALEATPWHTDGDIRYPKTQTLNASVVARTVQPAIPVRRHTWWQYSYRPLGLCNRINGGFDHIHGYQRDFAGGDLVKPEVPDVTIVTLAYWQTRKSPTSNVTVGDNVAVWLALDRNSGFDWPYHSFYDPKFSDASASQAEQHGATFAKVSERDLFARWKEISPRLMFWMYPTQYRNTYAPMPILPAVAENIRFAAENGVEMVYAQTPGSDVPWEDLRAWVTAKLLWDPTLNVRDLAQDFIWGGYFGNAASEVSEYHDLLTENAARYNDFDLRRDWIYPIYNEGIFRHGFVEKARELLDRALAKADNDTLRHRVGLLKFGVVFVEASQLYVQMRDGESRPDLSHYDTVRDELMTLGKELNVGTVRLSGGAKGIDFYDRVRRISNLDEFHSAMNRAKGIVLSKSIWGDWTFRKDPHDVGSRQKWFDFVEKHVLNPDTGYPDMAGCNEPDVAMAGLCKILFAYLAIGRDYPYPERAIDATLALQEIQGDFKVRPDIHPPEGQKFILRYARDMCINWDAMWVLRTLDAQLRGQYRRDDLVASSTALAECLIRDYQKPDGGFAFAADHCLMIHMGIWLGEPFPVGDVIGTFMCVECLKYADEWIGQGNC